jgi:hypothetical protein
MRGATINGSGYGTLFQAGERVSAVRAATVAAHRLTAASSMRCHGWPVRAGVGATRLNALAIIRR